MRVFWDSSNWGKILEEKSLLKSSVIPVDSIQNVAVKYCFL